MLDKYKQNPSNRRYATNTTDWNFNFNEAVLLREIGREVDMTYGANGSGSTIGEAKRFLGRIGYSDAHRFDATESKINMMLTERRFPVYVRGEDKSKNAGHAWVIDGVLRQRQKVEEVAPVNIVISTSYGYRTLYHCNFGWYGQCDGYYYIHSICNPTTAKPQVTESGDLNGTDENIYSSGMEVITYTGY